MGHHKHREEDEFESRKQQGRESLKERETRGTWTPPPDTKSVIRGLKTPPDKERESPGLYLEYDVHRNIGPNKRFGMCGNPVGGHKNRCWLCKKRAQLIKEGRTSQAAKLAPQRMLAIQVAVYNDEMETFIGPLLWAMTMGGPDSMGVKMMEIITSKRRDYFDHKHGYDLDFRRRGVGLKTKWGDIDHAEDSSKVPKGIIKKLKPFCDLEGLRQYDEQWLKDAYYGREKEKEKGKMAKKKKDESDESVSDTSSSDASESNASDSDASGSDTSSSDTSSSDTKSKKKKKKSKKDESDSDSSSSDSDSDADSSDSDSSSSDSDSDASSSDEDDSDKESSDSDSSSSDSDESDDDEKPKKRGRGKAKKAKKVKKTRGRPRKKK